MESRRARANAESPGPFEIGSAERRNHTDNPLAAISWQGLKEGTLRERGQKASRRRARWQEDQEQKKRNIRTKEAEHRETVAEQSK